MKKKREPASDLGRAFPWVEFGVPFSMPNSFGFAGSELTRAMG
jgi:hypothetical protein